MVCKNVSGLKTYYVYDDFGQLRAVIQPAAEALFPPTGGTTSGLDAFATDGVFAYDYDARGRMTRKRVPGAATVTMTYNDRNLLVSSTDGNANTMTYIYDELNRSKTTTDGQNQILTESFYDDYTFANAQAYDQTHAYGQTAMANVKGLPTGNRVLVLGTNKYITSTNYYEAIGKGTVQSVTYTDYDNRGKDRLSSLLDFTGRALASKQTLDNKIETQTKQSYELGGRLKAVCQSITPFLLAGAGWEPISRLIYNDLGELTTKTLGCNLQNVDYSYDLKSRLMAINNPSTLVNDKDLFGMALSYDAVGNITTWNYAQPDLNPMGIALNTFKNYAYTFTYDGLNRLKTSNLNKNNISLFSNTQNYDLNGNVLTLQRTFNGSIVDNMAYTYQGINKLGSITDNGTNPTTGEFFKDGTANYTYDQNGNLKTDTGKNISNIAYNYLNLVSQVIVNNQTLNYVYTATGQKLKYSTPTNKYEYFVGVVYKNDTIEFVPTAEGRWMKSGFEYNLKDHLGNVRTSFTCQNGTLKVNQENHYDPWGLSLPIGVEGKDRFTYNSKEKQDGTGWLDYGARMYDPQKVVWNGIDVLSEKYSNLSGYNYVANNPLRYIDPDGRDIGISELMKNKDHAQAFIQFAKTKEGTRFLNNFASKGQKFEYEGKVFYEAKEAGIYHNAGINLNYSISRKDGESATTNQLDFKKGLKLNVNIEIAKEGYGSENKIFNLAKSIVHESFLHGKNAAADFKDNGWSDNSTLPKEYRQYGNHADHYYISKEFFYHPENKDIQLFPIQGLSILRQVSENLNLNYNDTKIKTLMWFFDGSLIDISPKNGQLKYKKNGT